MLISESWVVRVEKMLSYDVDRLSMGNGEYGMSSSSLSSSMAEDNTGSGESIKNCFGASPSSCSKMVVVVLSPDSCETNLRRTFRDLLR